MTQKKRQLSHFLNFYVFLTVELPAAELKAIREERNRRHEDDEAFMNYAGENADASFVQPLSSDAINEAVAEDDLSVTELG